MCDDSSLLYTLKKRIEPKHTSSILSNSHKRTRTNESIAKTYDLNNNNFEVYSTPLTGYTTQVYHNKQAIVTNSEDDEMQESNLKYHRRQKPDHTGIWIAFVAWVIIVMSGVIFAGYRVKILFCYF